MPYLLKRNWVFAPIKAFSPLVPNLPIGNVLVWQTRPGGNRVSRAISFPNRVWEREKIHPKTRFLITLNEE
jgi:hypothetical protein